MQTGGSAEVPVKIQSVEGNVVWLSVLDRLESAFQKDMYLTDLLLLLQFPLFSRISINYMTIIFYFFIFE